MTVAAVRLWKVERELAFEVKGCLDVHVGLR